MLVEVLDDGGELAAIRDSVVDRTLRRGLDVVEPANATEELLDRLEERTVDEGQFEREVDGDLLPRAAVREAANALRESRDPVRAQCSM
jgi:hypothetical protein